MIIAFIGRPESGKGTQAELLGRELQLPVFSMGDLIRQAREVGNPEITEAYSKYSLLGKHIPNAIKFPLLKSKLDMAGNGFILDNYPATQEDVETFNAFLIKQGLQVNKVFHIVISQDEAIRRMKVADRGRLDDNESIIRERFKIQDQDRDFVVRHFKNMGILEEINGEDKIDKVHLEVMSCLSKAQREGNGKEK